MYFLICLYYNKINLTFTFTIITLYNRQNIVERAVPHFQTKLDKTAYEHCNNCPVGHTADAITTKTASPASCLSLLVARFPSNFPHIFVSTCIRV